MKIKIFFLNYLKDGLYKTRKTPKPADLIKQKSMNLSYSLPK